MRTLAEREFPAGEPELVWDGLDRDGRAVARGVYFTRFRYRDQGFVSTRKLVVLE